MTAITRTEILDTLTNGWGTYVARYRTLPPGEQQAWLAAQGYARFADLLAHVTAWWIDGQHVAISLVADPDFPLRNYDVDAFNAEAVARYAAVDEDAMIAAFERHRAQWVVLVAGLSDAALAEPKITDSIRIEIADHLAEHALPGQ